MGDSGGESTSVSEEERIRLWKAQLAQEESDENSDAERDSLDGDEDQPLRLPRSTAGDRSASVHPDVQSDQRLNEDLLRRLEEQHEELSFLRRQIASGAIVVGKPPATDLVDTREKRIAELVRKNKAAQITLERERTRANELERQLQLARAEFTEKLEQQRKLVKQSENAQRMKELKDRNADMAEKLTSLRTQHELARTEIQRLHRALQDEIGEGVAVRSILDGSSGSKGWRGRAQEISLLKSKIGDLKRRLSERSTGDDQACSSSESSVVLSADSQRRTEILRIEKAKRQELDELKNRLAESGEELGKAKRELDGRIARIHNLENELRSLKEKVRVLLDKSGNDDQLIEKLQNELQERTKLLRDAQAVQRCSAERVLNHAPSEGAEHTGLREQVRRLEDLLSQSNDELLHLRQYKRSDLASQTIDRVASGADIEAAKLEASKMGEMVSMLKGKIAEAEETIADLLREKQQQAGSSSQRGGRGIGRKAGIGRAGKAQVQGGLPAPKPLDEHVKAQLEMKLERKDEEVRMLRALLKEEKALFEDAVLDLRRSIHQLLPAASVLSQPEPYTP